MGQSKAPAVCGVCEAVGPRRPQAAREGWRSSEGKGCRSVWVCPPCVAKIQAAAPGFATEQRPISSSHASIDAEGKITAHPDPLPGGELEGAP